MAIETLPRGFTVRRPTMDDVEAVLQLKHSIEIALYGQPDTSLADLRTEWSMPSFDLAADAWLLLSPDEHIIGFGSIEHNEHFRLIIHNEVHPDYQGQGIDSYLLELVEQRALEHIPLADPALRVTLVAWVGEENLAKQRLLEQHGFKVARHFQRMGIELVAPQPQPQWAPGIVVRTMPPDMLHAVYVADEEAFKDHWGHVSHPYADFLHWTIERPGWDPSYWFLAMDGSEIAGLALCGDEKEHGAWVYTLGVLRPWRNKGLGMALLQHAFAEFYRRGVKNAYLVVDAQSLTGATRLYQRAGMRVVRQHKRYEKVLRPGVEPSTQTLAE